MIHENIKKIQNAIEKNKLVVFIGAGVSLNSNIPSWGQLIQAFCKALNIDSNNLSTEDYLKIPQYYFNQRGFKEYYDMVQNIIGIKAEPNIIHDLILKMSPAHIVTTNYDNLIEQAIEKHLLFYDVVSENNDLPYTPNGRMIIKMHGDLDKKNIVLKEDDYLHYSINFSMIETFVKSLFINHTVLFIGYSLNDYNLKLIMSSIKSVLGEHYQKAYLIDTSKEKDEYLKNYISSLGVNIIDINQIKKNVNKEYKTLEKEEGKRLAQIIEYIISENEYENFIEKYYDKLKVLDNLEYCLIRNLIERIKFKGNLRIKNETLYIYNDSEIKELIKELKKLTEDSKDYEKYKVIRNVFLRCGIRILEVDDEEGEYFEFDSNSKYETLQHFTSMEKNNFMEIVSLAEKGYADIEVTKNKYLNQMIRAFCNYNIGRYVTAYDILDNISNSAFRDKNYLYYYICEYNMNQLIRLIDNRGFGVVKERVYTEHLNKIEECHNKKANTSIDTYCMLSKVERNKIEHLKDIILNTSFLSRELSTMIDLVDKVKKATMTSYIGKTGDGFDEVGAIAIKGKEIWNYICGNTLMVVHYSEVINFYKYYAEGLLETYNKNKYNCLENQDDFFRGFEQTVIEDYKFKMFDLSVVSKFLKPDDLLDLVKTNKIDKIVIDKFDNLTEDDYMLPLLYNSIQSYINVDYYMGRENIINNLFIFAAHIKLGKKFFTNINEVLVNLIKSDKLNNESYKYIEYFIKKQAISNEYITQFALCCVNALLEKIALWDRREKYINANSVLNVINLYFIPNVLNYINCKNGEELAIDEKSLSKILQEIDGGILKEHNDIFIKKLIIPLLNYISDESKSELLKYIKLDKNMKSDSVYLRLCIDELIEHSEEHEKRLYEEIDILIKNEKSTYKISPDPIETKLMYIANLRYINKLLDIDRAKTYKGRNNYYDFIIDPKEFDYENKLNIEWLIHIKKEEFLLNEVLVNEKSYKAIKQKLQNYILENDNVEKNIKEFYFKYCNNS